MRAVEREADKEAVEGPVRVVAVVDVVAVGTAMAAAVKASAVAAAAAAVVAAAANAVAAAAEAAVGCSVPGARRRARLECQRWVMMRLR